MKRRARVALQTARASSQLLCKRFIVSYNSGGIALPRRPRDACVIAIERMAYLVVHVLLTFALINDLLGGSIVVLAEANVGCFLYMNICTRRRNIAC